MLNCCARTRLVLFAGKKGDNAGLSPWGAEDEQLSADADGSATAAGVSVSIYCDHWMEFTCAE